MSKKPSSKTRDLCTEDGANEIKNRIQAYWNKRGENVDVRLKQSKFTPEMRTARVDVRSNMINGMPRQETA